MSDVTHRMRLRNGFAMEGGEQVPTYGEYVLASDYDAIDAELDIAKNRALAYENERDALIVALRDIRWHAKHGDEYADETCGTIANDALLAIGSAADQPSGSLKTCGCFEGQCIVSRGLVMPKGFSCRKEACPHCGVWHSQDCAVAQVRRMTAKELGDLDAAVEFADRLAVQTSGEPGK